MFIEIDKDEAVRIIRINRGDKNYFNQPFMDELNKALDDIESDESASSVIFIGSLEKHFANGLDLDWILTQPKEVWLEFLVTVDLFFHRVFTYPKPVVAAINGHAFAGGLFLALSCDWRVMREDRGWLCIPEVDLGIDLPPGNIALVTHVIGQRNCEHLALTGKKISAKQALAYGMVDEIAPAGEVLKKALDMAKSLGLKNPKMYKSHKLGIRKEVARCLAEDDPPFIRGLLSKEEDWG